MGSSVSRNRFKRHPQVDYDQFRRDVVIVACRYNQCFEECWTLAQQDPLHASECYRSIVRSLNRPWL